jgi:uncharacterized membrane protein YfcA
MSLFSVAIVLAALLTSILSGIFGMAGGLILMGIFAWMLPAASALALHGLIQFSSNLWRLLLHRAHVAWRVLFNFGFGAVLAMGLVALVAFTPTKQFVFLALGLLPVLVWIPERWFRLDALTPSHAIIGGFASTSLSLISGVSGPLTDLLFVRTEMSRHSIVATRAAMQAIGHASKVLVYGALLLSPSSQALVPTGTAAAAIAASMVGIVLGGKILDRMSDAHFKWARRWIVTMIGVVFLAQAGQIALG